jgi:hypothetical protein
MTTTSQLDERLSKIEKVIFGDAKEISVNYATTSNISLPLMNNVSIDGIIPTLDNKVFLLAGQTDKKENGIYVLISYSPFTFQRVSWFKTFDNINNKKIKVLSGTLANSFFISSISTQSFIINEAEINIDITEESVENLQENKMNKVLTALSNKIAIFNEKGQVIDSGFSIDNTSQSISSSPFTIPTSDLISKSGVDGGLF